MKKLSCYYCDHGQIDEADLPCACPTCGESLKKNMEKMTEQEKTEAWLKKMTRSGMIEYTLAS